MPSHSATMLPPLGRSPQRAKTAHTSASLPLPGAPGGGGGGGGRAFGHQPTGFPPPPPPPAHHHTLPRQLYQRGRHHSPQVHRRLASTGSGKACSLPEHGVGLMTDAPELPEIADLLRQGATSRATIVQMIERGICRTSFNDVQRFPAITPSIMSSRMDRFVRYITFVSAPPIERRAPKDRPKSWDRKAFKPLGPEECFRCQLQTDHAVCERHKYLRVGGGFRHSYWYIKRTMDIIEVEQRKVTEEIQQRYLKELAKKAKKAQTRRRIKTYVRGADGKVVSRYCFVTEEEYQEMKTDDKLAKKVLGLAEGEELDDWVSSKQKYVMDEKGELVKVSKRKIRDSAYEGSVESADVSNSYRKGRRRNKGRHHRRQSDSDSFESGMGNSILEEGEGGRRRRGRRGRHRSDRYSSDESIVSYESSGGTRRKRRGHRRRRRHDSFDGSNSSDYDGADDKRHRRRRRRRDRSYSRSDSGTDVDSGDSRRGRGDRRRDRRHGGRRHRGRRRRHYGSSSSDYSGGSEGGRDGGRRGKRGGRRRRGRRSYSEDSDDSRDSRRRRGRHRRKKHSSYSDESDVSEEGEGGVSRKRRGRHHRSRRHRDYSSDSSDYSDSEGTRRRDRRHRRRHRRRHGSGSDASDGSSAEDGDDDVARGHRRGRRRRHRRHGSDRDIESSSGGEDSDREGRGGARGGRRRRRGHRRRGDVSDSYSDSDGGSASSGRGRRRRRRRRRHSDSSDGSYDSDDDFSAEGRDGRAGGRRRGGRRGRRRRSRGDRRDSSEDSSYSLTDSGESEENEAGTRRKRRKGRAKAERRGGRGGRARRGSGHGSPRGHSSGSYTSSSSYSSDESSATLSGSSEVSEASNPSSVHSSDLSDIDSGLDGEERKRVKAFKKAQKMEQKRAAKQQLKIETRKEAREVKRERIKQEKKERRREKRSERRTRGEERRGRGERRDRRDKKRRPGTPTSRSVSQCSSVSTPCSDDISDVDSALTGHEKKQALEAKKAQRKAEKKAAKQKEKVDKVQTEHRERRKEKERKRIKREIERELDRMSSPSAVSSVRSSDLSSLSEQEGLTAEEKAKRKETKKKKKKEEKKKEKKLLQAVQKVMAKRNKRRSSFSSDDSYARGKQDFYDLPPEVRKTMVKYSKGSKRGLVDGEGMDWLDDWKNKKERKERKKKNKKGKGELAGDMVELKAPDGRVVRVPKTSMYDVWKQARKVRLKKDGTVARDSDSDAESIEIDSDGNMATQPKTVHLTEADDSCASSCGGFAPTPQPPLSPTEGGKIQFQGVRKVHHAFRKDMGVLSEHLKKVLDTASELSEQRDEERLEATRVGRGRSAWESVDYISHFRLVESNRLDSLGRAFVVEDVDYDCTLTTQEMRSAVEGVPSLSSIKPKQLEYVLKVLDIDEHTTVSFKMFAVVAGVCERMCNMDSFGKYILDKTDLLDIARKMALYKSIFYCNVNSERSSNHITVESMRIELIAGGLNREQERYIISKMNPNEYGEISFFDYMAYIPLFLSMHENIIDNPLDRREKYSAPQRAEIQRDMNPLGLPLQRAYIDVPKEIFPSGIPASSGGDAISATPRGSLSDKGKQLLKDTLSPGKGARFPSIGKTPSSQASTKTSDRYKNTSLSLQ